MLSLAKLAPAKGSNRRKKRLGRGPGSGRGDTSGKGHKGFHARSGSNINPAYEGGQMPLYRRIPKRGFRNIFRQHFAFINVGTLNDLSIKEVTFEELKKLGVISSGKAEVLKILGKGDLKKALVVKAHKFSQLAKSKIEKAGGKAEVIGE